MFSGYERVSNLVSVGRCLRVFRISV